MTVTIDPSDFTRLMALPAHDRHDLLEFLGSTLSGGLGDAGLFLAAAGGQVLASAMRPDQPRRPEAH